MKGSVIAIILVVAIAVVIILHRQGSLVGDRDGTERSSRSSTSRSLRDSSSSGTSVAGNSSYSKNIKISSVKNASALAGIEHIVISASRNKEPISVTGWSITSKVSGNKAYIGTATPLPEILPEQNLMLGSGEKIILLTGGRPNDVAFRVNLCTGYLEKYYNDYPPLPMQCPDIEDEGTPNKVEDSEECMDYIRSMDKCKEAPNKFPNYLPSYCEDFIESVASYPACVSFHQDEKNFYKPEWRAYAKSKFPLWQEDRPNRKDETLELRDAQGNLVNTFSY